MQRFAVLLTLTIVLLATASAFGQLVFVPAPQSYMQCGYPSLWISHGRIASVYVGCPSYYPRAYYGGYYGGYSRYGRPYQTPYRGYYATSPQRTYGTTTGRNHGGYRQRR